MDNDLAAELARLSSPLPWKPDILDPSDEKDVGTIRSLLADGVRFVRDDFEEQLREHYAFLNPTRVFSPDFGDGFRAHKTALEAQAPLWRHGRWIHYPWRGTLVHVLEEKAFRQVRTSRNRNLITEEEQRRFADAVVGIAGLSVGNSIALAIVLQGGANRIRLADFDLLSLSNINRVRASVADLGANKAEMTARQIFEIDPYAQVDIVAEGLTQETIGRFFDGPPKIDIVIDEIDNLAVKCLIREHAKRLRLPVVMAADNGDNGVVDIERYDLDQEIPYFHGRMGPVTYEKLKNLDKMSIGRLITKHVGPETVTPKMRASLLEIGKTIVSWPQLGGAALLNGSAVAYCVRSIVCGHPLEQDRALIDLDEKLVPGHDSAEMKEKRKQEAAEFARVFGI